MSKIKIGAENFTQSYQFLKIIFSEKILLGKNEKILTIFWKFAKIFSLEIHKFLEIQFLELFRYLILFLK